MNDAWNYIRPIYQRCTRQADSRIVPWLLPFPLSSSSDFVELWS